MANNYVQFSECLTLRNEGESQWAADHLGFFGKAEEWEELETHPQYGRYKGLVDLYEQGDPDAARLEFEWDLEEGSGQQKDLYIFSDEVGNVEHAATFVQQYLQRFYNEGCFRITWAETCAQPRAGEFCGGAVFITEEKIEWMSTYGWAEERRKEFDKQYEQKETQ